MFDDREENPAASMIGLAIALIGGVGVAYYLKRRKAGADEPKLVAKVEEPTVTAAPPPVASDPFGNRQPSQTFATPKTGAVDGFPSATWTDVQVGANRVIRAINAGRTVMTSLNERPADAIPELAVDGIVGPVTFGTIQTLGRIMAKAQSLNTVEFRSPYAGINPAMVPNGYVAGSSWVDPMQTASEGVPVSVLTSAANRTYDERQLDKTVVRRLLWFAGKASYGDGATAPESPNMGAKYLLAKAAVAVR